MISPIKTMIPRARSRREVVIIYPQFWMTIRSVNLFADQKKKHTLHTNT